VDDSLEYLAITRLQAAYGDAVTRRAWPEFRSMFLPECPVRLDLRAGSVIEHRGPDAIARFIAQSIERFSLFMFVPLNTVVEVDAAGREARGRLYIQELRQSRDEQTWSTAYGLYTDQYAKRDGRWWFAQRDYASLARTAADGRGMETFPIPDA
jgi:hypothetical protein